jgi:membrane protease YdiL (CAAX protease family)
MKNARYMILLVVALALPYLIVGLFAGGSNAARTFQAGLLMLVLSGAVFGWMIWRGKKVDPERDERENLHILKAMAFAFYVMIIAVGTYVQWPASPAGGAVDASIWLSAVLWGSFLVGYVYNQVRH